MSDRMFSMKAERDSVVARTAFARDLEERVCRIGTSDPPSLLRPAPRLYRTERFPEISERCNLTALFGEAASVFLNVVGELLCASCFGIDAGPSLFSFVRRTRRPFAFVVQRRKNLIQTLPSCRRSIFLIHQAHGSCASQRASPSDIEVDRFAGRAYMRARMNCRIENHDRVVCHGRTVGILDE